MIRHDPENKEIQFDWQHPDLKPIPNRTGGPTRQLYKSPVLGAPYDGTPRIRSFMVRMGPGLFDPLDQAPITAFFTNGLQAMVTVSGWRATLAVWFLRRYISGIK